VESCGDLQTDECHCSIDTPGRDLSDTRRGLRSDDPFAFLAGRLEPGDEIVEHAGSDGEGVVGGGRRLAAPVME
jgi:hypothetical protein